MLIQRKRNILITIVVMATLILALAACGNNENQANEGEGNGDNASRSTNIVEQVLHLSTTADFTSLDIHHASDEPSFNALYQIGEGLIGFDKEGNFIPTGAAEEPEVNDDLTEYTFTIRDNAVWENGDPVTANDFVYAWKRAVHPDTASEYAFIYESANILNAKQIMDPDSDLYGNVDELGIKAVDEKTVEITLEKATPYFVSLMSFPPFYPLNEEFVEGLGDEYATSVENLLSNGPYKLTDWHIGEGWTYEKNDTYWNADDVKLEQVNVKLVKDAATRVNLYQTGDLDYAELSAQFIQQFEGSDELHKGELITDMKFMRMNQKHEAIANPKIRSAIYNAFDRQELVDSLLKNGAAPAYFVVPEDWAFDENGEDFRAKYPEINKMSVEEAQ